MADSDELFDLFDAALALPAAARAAFLAERCADRPELRAELASLLAHADRRGGLLDRPPPIPRELGAGQPPAEVGPYRLVERLGAGGFGDVWRAEQSEPIARTVAVKLIRQGVASAQALARFAVERQALALLAHPGIARIHDAGTTADGQPWYAMELVDGPTITDFARRYRLGLADRVRLVVQVCDALHHAHERGIVHRDLKPSNVLVQGDCDRAQPKLIDFGIAKLHEADAAWQTQDGQIVGTPAYMSPEQARGDVDAVDARTDVHAVGVLLFELVTGTVPFEPKSTDASGLLALQRRICEDEPPRPSMRIVERSREPSYRPPVLARAVRGDLDWIVLKALSKARALRYATARELEIDLGRFLVDQPVTAMPPSRIYRLRKWLQRHRAVAAAAGLAVLVGVVGAIATIENRARAERSEQTVRTEARKLTEVTMFLRDLLAHADPEQSPGHDVTVTELLDTAERQLAAGVAPEVETALRYTIGLSYRGLGRPLDAERNLRRALELADRTAAPEGGEVRRELGLLFMAAGRRSEAAGLFERALELAGDDPVPRLLAHDARGLLRAQQADYAGAIEDFRAGLAIAARCDPDPGIVTALWLHLADALDGQGRYGEAGDALAEARALAVAAGDVGRPLLLQVDTARIRRFLRDDAPDRALECAQDSVRIAERIYGPRHFEVGFYRCSNAEVLQACDRLVAAEDEFRAGIGILHDARPEGSISEAHALGNLGWTLARLERHDEAESMLRQALEMTRRLLGADHPDVASCLRDLAKVLRARGANVEAEQACREALAIQRDKLGSGHLHVAATLHALALALIAQERAAEAADQLEEAVRIGAAQLPDAHRDLTEFRMRLGHVYVQLGRYDEARALLESCYDLVVKTAGPDDRRAAICAAAMLRVARATGDDALAALWEPRAAR
ncbi:MAG: serine/threonine protein kinase [Planctomycetes bacterium]|nr:serine/threonine protein kinase [Planctomycetota bacterium]